MHYLRIMALTALTVALSFPATAAENRLRLATATEVADTGLLKALLPVFEKKYACKVVVSPMGAGNALKLAGQGKVDVVITNTRELEDRFISRGFGLNPRDVMYNDFVIIGPKDDPAGVRESQGAPAALKRIAATRAGFISSGDESGTHLREKELWDSAGVKPGGEWYINAVSGMSEAIKLATGRHAYTLADRGTYFAWRDRTDLEILFQDEGNLVNNFRVIAVNPRKHPNVNHELAEKFIGFLAGPEGEEIISRYTVNNDSPFFLFFR